MKILKISILSIIFYSYILCMQQETEQSYAENFIKSLPKRTTSSDFLALLADNIKQATEKLMKQKLPKEFFRNNCQFDLIHLEDGIIATGCADGKIGIYDILNPSKQPKKLAGHKYQNHSYISCLVRLENNQIASGSSDGEIKIWDTVTGECLITINSRGPVNSLICLNENKIASLHEWHTNSHLHIGSISIWDIQQGKEIKNIENKELFQNVTESLKQERYPLSRQKHSHYKKKFHEDIRRELDLENGAFVEVYYDGKIKMICPDELKFAKNMAKEAIIKKRQ